ncbi:MAG: tryptophan-rich sensory protein [Mesorhizobium sp.]|nr:TspO/MBR family protein [Mesorhizobium sp.]MBL8580161.1 tryptophan-rich sensory protein [Mesorhizobium sp.]
MSARSAITPFILLVVGGGLLIGLLTAPGPWYAELAKPSFNPPNWIFGPVWTILYVLIAVAGWRVWQRDRSGPAIKLWWLQLVLNFAWSPVFFALHSVGFALVIIVALFATILAFIAVARSTDHVSAWLFVPYACWVGFASLLNGAIWQLN